MRNSGSLFLTLKAVFRAEKKVLKKGTFSIIAEAPHLVVYSLPMLVMSYLLPSDRNKKLHKM
jgi:hypothetical protein